MMFLRESIQGFIDALDDATECALKHNDTQLGGANYMLEDRTTVQRDLDRMGIRLAGTLRSSISANAKTCSCNPTTAGSRTNQS